MSDGRITASRAALAMGNNNYCLTSMLPMIFFAEGLALINLGSEFVMGHFESKWGYINKTGKTKLNDGNRFTVSALIKDKVCCASTGTREPIIFVAGKCPTGSPEGG